LNCYVLPKKQENLGITGVKLIDGSQFLPESKRGIPTPWVAFHKKITGSYKFFKVQRLAAIMQHLN
jgi:hypothetical protein